MKNFFLLLTVLFLLSVPLRAQRPLSDMALIEWRVAKSENVHTGRRHVRLQKSSGLASQLLSLPLFFYQKFLSEQISALCEFEPSCSNFSAAAIKEFGLFKGVFLTADRLTRCNGQAQMDLPDYLINHSNGKAVDEPSMYRFKD